MDATDEVVEEALQAGANYYSESLDQPIGSVDDGETLARGLSALSPRERWVLLRAFLQGHSQRDIAQELEVSQMQVSRILSGTLERLRQQLAVAAG